MLRFMLPSVQQAVVCDIFLTGFGTGSAALWDGHDSVKSVAEMFANTGSLDTCASTGLGYMTPEEQHTLMEAATQV